MVEKDPGYLGFAVSSRTEFEQWQNVRDDASFISFDDSYMPLSFKASRIPNSCRSQIVR